MTDVVVRKELFNFQYLPEFAGYILKNKLEEFVTVGIRFCREADLPILKPLSKFSEPELVKLSIDSNREMLTALAGGRIAEYIENGAQKWMSNSIGYLDKEDIMVEDLTMGFFLRRKIFAYFLDAYTKNVVMQKFIISELDIYTTQEELIAYTLYLKTQREKFAVHRNFLLETQEHAEIGSYLVNFKDRTKSIYTPQYMKILDLDVLPTYEELMTYIHPEDRQDLAGIVEAAMKNGGQYELEYRYTKGGNEKRIWSKGVIEMEDGQPVLAKGSIRDITQRHAVVQQLEETKRLYKLGQELNTFGNWSWDLNTARLQWSDEMYSIFEVEAGTPITFGEFVSFIHPDDKEKIKGAIENMSVPSEKSEYIFKITTAKGNAKMLKGISVVQLTGQKLIARCYGTCQDITHASEPHR